MTSKNILINNGNLGRMGKTTLAYTLYKTAKEPFKYVTNDLENASIKLKNNIAEGDLTYVPSGTEIDINPKDNIIFDFGGKPDARLLEVAEYVDFIIVPIAYQSNSELQLTIKNINALMDKNKNIIVIINNTELADTKLVKTTLAVVFEEEDITILEINHSKFMRRLANENKTVFEVAMLNKGDATRLNRKIIPQFKELFKTLDIKLKVK